MRSPGSALLFAMLAVQTSCAAGSAFQYEKSRDNGGCVVEHIAVGPNTDYYQFDGISPDGTIISIGWSRDGEMGMFLLDLMTGERQDVPALNNSASFSPDGKLLTAALYDGDGVTDIFEYELASGLLTPVAPHAGPDWLPSYSPDGETIVFNSFRSGQSEIYTYDRIGGGVSRWTARDGYDAHAQFSPDGSGILFLSAYGADDHDVSVIDIESGEARLVTGSDTNDSYGSWSPDGGKVIFVSDRNQERGNTDLFLMNLPDGTIRQLTDNPYEDSYPFYSPDGRFVYFNSIRGGRYGVYRISVDEDGLCAL